jgi:hypothetical protein
LVREIIRLRRLNEASERRTMALERRLERMEIHGSRATEGAAPSPSSHDGQPPSDVDAGHG